MHRRSLQAALALAVAAMGATTFDAPRADAALRNRYSFTTDATDSIGGQNGTLFGANGSFAGGELVLANTGEGSENPGDGAYLNLPNALISTAAAADTVGSVTVEMWITMDANRDWAAAFSAGKSNQGEDTASCCNGDEPYIQIIPRTGDGGAGNDFRVTTNSEGANEGWVEDAGDGTDLFIGRKEHIVAVFDQSGGTPGTITVYRNGSIVDAPQAISANLNLTTFAGGSDNAGNGPGDAGFPEIPGYDPNVPEYNVWLGRSQWGDSLAAARYDEVRIYSNVVTADEALAHTVFGPDVTGVSAIPSIIVDKDTGNITLKNNEAAPVSLEYYSITSAGNALSTGGWSSLDSQNYNAIDGTDGGTTAGDSLGEGWDASGGSNSGQLIELFLGEAGSMLAGNAELNLGNAYNTSVFGGSDGDLVFKFGLNGGALITAPVTYVGGGSTAGDFNSDGKVDGADFLAWQRGYPGNQPGQLLSDWEANYGTGAAVAAVGAVPEPTTIAMALLGLTGLACAAKRRD